MLWRAISFATIALPLCLIAEQLPIRSYTAADGLAGDRVDCIVPDSRGFIWFCTPEGLTRFDGYRLVGIGTREGLPDRAIYAFLETKSGAYLVGTQHGLSQFNSAGSRGFVTYKEGRAIVDRPIFSLWESSSGTIWCGVGSQLREALNSATLGPAKWSAPNGVWITDINEDAAGRLWVATNVGIYVLGKSGGVQHIAQEQGLSALWVNKLLRDRAGELWAGTRNGLALIGDSSGAPGFRVRRIYTEKDGLPNHDVIAMAEAPDGGLWISTKVGISVLESGSRTLRNLTRENGLTDIAINALAAEPFRKHMGRHARRRGHADCIRRVCHISRTGWPGERSSARHFIGSRWQGDRCEPPGRRAWALAQRLRRRASQVPAHRSQSTREERQLGAQPIPFGEPNG
jgi:ligand-binding sensor domain-containing protein